MDAGSADHDRYGVLSVEQIITHSSNIGAAKIGLKLGEDRLYQYIHNYGFGTRLPASRSRAESPGIVHAVSNWTKVSIAQIPMGQGIAVTRLQMIMAMCAMANKGVLMPPMLVDRLEDQDRNVKAKYSPQRGRRVVSEATARNGRGPQNRRLHQRHRAQGRPGPLPGCRQNRHGPEGRARLLRQINSSPLFWDSSRPTIPELCISVTLDEPRQGHYGGAVAGPIFKQIAEAAANYLNIRPDDSPAPDASEKLAAPLEDQPIRTASARSQ